MAGEHLIFDAAGSNPDGTDPGSPLNVGPGQDLTLREWSTPAPAFTVQYASSVDTEGGVPVSSKPENRELRLKILCQTATALRSLQAKAGKVSREGGTLKWTLPNSEVVIFDLHAADGFEPEFRITYYRDAGKWCDVTLSFTARPTGRGSSVSATLSGSPATSKAPLVFTTTGVKGDMLAIGDLRVTNATTNKTWLCWGMQSRYYDSAASAALFIEAENGSSGSASANAGPSGASGGGVNKVMRHTSIGTSTAISFSVLPSSGSALTHIGSFRVYARVQAATANTGVVSARINWKPRLAGGEFIANDWVAIADNAGTAIENSWVLVDLGMVTIPKARVGNQAWWCQAEVTATTSGNQLDWDWFAFVPTTEGYGLMQASGLAVGSTASVDISDQGVLISSSSDWFTPTEYAGDYLGGQTGIPPAGAENRTLRMIVIFTGPTTSAGNLSTELTDAVNLDAVSATLSYTPRYLVVPEP